MQNNILKHETNIGTDDSTDNTTDVQKGQIFPSLQKDMSVENA